MSVGIGEQSVEEVQGYFVNPIFKYCLHIKLQPLTIGRTCELRVIFDIEDSLS